MVQSMGCENVETAYVKMLKAVHNNNKTVIISFSRFL